MDVMFDREGNCLKCKGTGKCISCGGSGRNRFDEKLVCPTCKGKGDCICHGQKKEVSLCDSEKEIESLKALCFCTMATKHKPLTK